MSKTKTTWINEVWDPVTGCTQISSGCENCYCISIAEWYESVGNTRYNNGFQVTLHEDLIDKPLHWRKPREIFVNSMSDLFHEEVPDDFIIKVFNTMNQTLQHRYQVLTKRPDRAVVLSHKLQWTENIWMGVSVENQNVITRIDALRKVPANLRYLYLEPLIGPINNINLDGIHWVIVGGEYGPHARPMELEWARDIMAECRKQSVPFFFKQVGGKGQTKGGHLLDGQEYYEFPLNY